MEYRPTAAFFMQLRQYLGLSVDQAASLVKTTPEVIAALETGTLSRLPAWPKIQQIVWAYASLAGIDPTPALHSLQFHVNQVAAAAEPVAYPDTVPVHHRVAVGERLASWLPRRLLVWRIAAITCILMVAGLGAQSSMLEAAVATLPEPVGGLVRHAKTALNFKSSRTFEGLTWIDVDDPRARRADKLPTKRR